MGLTGLMQENSALTTATRANNAKIFISSCFAPTLWLYFFRLVFWKKMAWLQILSSLEGLNDLQFPHWEWTDPLSQGRS
jgi:hypothetical protein